MILGGHPNLENQTWRKRPPYRSFDFSGRMGPLPAHRPERRIWGIITLAFSLFYPLASVFCLSLAKPSWLVDVCGDQLPASQSRIDKMEIHRDEQ
jgi:hypothetical protein